MAPVKFSVGTASAPVSPTLQETSATESRGAFFPSQTAASNIPTLQENDFAVSASDPNLAAINAVDGLHNTESFGPDGVRSTDFAGPGSSSNAQVHHHHHHRAANAPAPIPMHPHTREVPAYSLAGAHAYEPNTINPYGMPKGTRRAGQRPVQGLGRAMPTWEEMQLRKALKAERLARHNEHQARKSGTNTPHPKTTASHTSMTSLTHPPVGEQEIHQALSEMYAAMHHLTSLLPEGYLPSGTATPFTITPAASRTVSRTQTGAMNGHSGEKGAELKQTTSHDSASSSSSSSDSDDNDDIKPNPYARFRHWIREPAAEFLGTALLLMFGTGVSNQFFLSMDPNVDSVVRGTYTSVSFGWGIGVMVGVYVSGGISGGHLNPAVTLSLAVFRKFPWRKVLPFMLAQVLGAMTGSAFVSLLYERAVSIFEGGGGIRTVVGPTSTANLYTTFRLPYMSGAAAFFNEFADTAILIITVFALGDSNNTPPPDGLNPIVLLFLIFGLGACLGSQTAYAINPARDLGPRLMLWMRGYGTQLWTVDDWYWIWTPIVGTLCGGLVGGLIYDLFIYTGAESPLNATWEFRGGLPRSTGSQHQAGNQLNEKLPAGGERQDHQV